MLTCPLRLALLIALVQTSVLSGCRSVEKLAAPSNIRDWQADQAELCSAEFLGDQVMIRNIRNCHYISDEVYIPDSYDKQVDLNDLKTVDFIICPFNDSPAIAHTMLSFGFEKPNGIKEQLAVSVEIRKEQGEAYAAWKGSARQYELMYVLADERDVINVRVNHRGEQVYVYRSNAEPETVHELFVDILNRTNKLAREPHQQNPAWESERRSPRTPPRPLGRTCVRAWPYRTPRHV
jgi:hypothetical protein